MDDYDFGSIADAFKGFMDDYGMPIGMAAQGLGTYLKGQANKRIVEAQRQKMAEERARQAAYQAQIDARTAAMTSQLTPAATEAARQGIAAQYAQQVAPTNASPNVDSFIPGTAGAPKEIQDSAAAALADANKRGSGECGGSLRTGAPTAARHEEPHRSQRGRARHRAHGGLLARFRVRAALPARGGEAGREESQPRLRCCERPRHALVPVGRDGAQEETGDAYSGRWGLRYRRSDLHAERHAWTLAWRAIPASRGAGASVEAHVLICSPSPTRTRRKRRSARACKTSPWRSLPGAMRRMTRSMRRAPAQAENYGAHSDLYREQTKKTSAERAIAESLLGARSPDSQDFLRSSESGLPIHTLRGIDAALKGQAPLDQYTPQEIAAHRRATVAIQPAYADKTTSPVDIAKALDTAHGR
jgi:hypothetical protein